MEQNALERSKGTETTFLTIALKMYNKEIG